MYGMVLAIHGVLLVDREVPKVMEAVVIIIIMNGTHRRGRIGLPWYPLLLGRLVPLSMIVAEEME